MRARRLPRRLRNNPGWLIILLLLIGVFTVSGLPYALASRDAQRPHYASLPTSLKLPAGISLSQLQTARIYEVVDGDTIDVLVDGKLEAVRYYGIDTPERGEICFREATDRNISLVGSKVLLLGDARNIDSFGRLLRYVFLEDGTSVDATLVAEGFARAWRQDGQYREQLVGLEQEAAVAGRGCLWGK